MKTRLFFAVLFFSGIVFAQIPTDYVARYEFSNNLNDSKGSANLTATSGSSRSYTTGKFGTALDLNGDFLTGYTSSSIGMQASMSFWLKTTSSYNASRIIALYQAQGGKSLRLILDSNNKEVQLGYHNGSVGAGPKITMNSVFDGGWHHFVITNNNGRIKTYVDGVLKTTLGYVGGGFNLNFDKSTSLQISPWGDYKDEIDDVQLFTREVSAQEISAIYQYQGLQPTTLSKIYVNTAVSGGDGSGDSWVNAMPSLQIALRVAGSNTTEIWIAKGTYKPGTARSSTFTVSKGNLSIYGSFAGTETNISERDIASNPTILSGDLNDNDDANVTYNNTTRGDNSLRIVSIRANNVVLDGFTVSSAHANAAKGEGRYSAGLKTENNVQNFTIKNCIIKDNVAWWSAGLGLYSDVNNSNMTIDACVFENNLSSASTSFYAVPSENRTMNVSVTNCLFKNNETRDNGTGRKASGSSAGWMRAYYRGSTINATVVNNTFVNNRSGGTKGGDYPTLGVSYNNGSGNLGTLTIANNIFWGNKRFANNTALAIGGVTDTHKASMVVTNSIDQDGFSNITNLTNTSNANPLFRSSTDFTLITGSPAIDAGDNTKVPSGISKDLAGKQRVHNTTVDMGAYEFGASSVLSIDEEVKNEDFLTVYPNPVSTTIFIKSSNEVQEVKVYNVLGKEVLQTKTNQLNVSNLQQGIYLVRIKTENNEVTKKIIKE